MILTTLVLFCCNTLYGDTPPTVPPPPSQISSLSATNSDRATATEPAKPDAPTPKTLTSSNANNENDLESSSAASLAMLTPVSSPVKPAIADSYETGTDRKIWYGLMIAGHGAAAFDAWTTRRAITSGYGIEGDPLQKPFANSGAIYATTQVTPLIMDYLGHRFMRSRHEWVRKAWWVPQVAGAGASFGVALHNYRVVP